MSGPQAPASKGANKKTSKSNSSSSSSSNPSSKKRKAPADSLAAVDAQQTTTTTTTQSGPNKRPKQKKTPSSKDATLDALLDLDNGINTIFSKMDPDLLADYVAAQTKRFGESDELSAVELSDLYVPAGAIRDTTSSTSEMRTKENMAAFLEANVGDDVVEKKRLGSAPKQCGAPHTIIVTGAGLRAADLVRATRKFQKKDSVVSKLVRTHSLILGTRLLPGHRHEKTELLRKGVLLTRGWLHSSQNTSKSQNKLNS